MSIYGDILDLAKTRAVIDDTKAQAGLRQAQTAALNDAAQIGLQSRMVARQFEEAKDQARNIAAGNTPAAGLGSATGIDANPQMVAIQSEINTAQGDYQKHTDLASAFRKSGNLPLAEKFDDNARQARQDIANAQLRLLQERKNALREIGGAAYEANETNFPAVRAQLDRLAPGWDKGQDVDFSPLEGGKVVWGDRTQNVLKHMGDASMTAAQQATRDHNVISEINTTYGHDITAREYQSREWKREQDVKLARENLERKNKTKEAKPPTVKEPSTSEVNANAPLLKDQLGVDDTAAKAAAWDFIRKRNELRAAGDSDPDGNAMAFVQGRVQPGSAGSKAPWYKPWEADEPAKPAKYGKGAVPETEDDKLGAALVTAGVESPMIKNGVVTGKDGAPVKVTTVAQAKLLPKGTRFIDPSGVERVVP